MRDIDADVLEIVGARAANSKELRIGLGGYWVRGDEFVRGQG
jgi:hypothetical protein